MAHMNDHRAVALAEGFEEAQDDDEVISAWQHLINTGLAWRLQGFFGRQAQDLIDNGICEAA